MRYRYERNYKNMIRKATKIFNILIIMIYLLTYAIGFCAFDDSGTNFDEDSFEERMLKVMVCLGISFTLTLISYLHLKKRKYQSTFIQLISNALQIPIVWYGISTTQKIMRSALYYNDTITEFHCKATIILSYVIIGLLSVLMLLAICNLISHLMHQNEENVQNNVDNAPKSYSIGFHTVTIIALLTTVVLLGLYAYGYMIVLLIVPFILCFPLPASILLATEVRTWIEQKKYIWSALAYIIYAYLVYGAFYRIFNSEINGLSFNFNTFTVPFYNIILFVNVLIAGFVAASLVAKSIKHRHAK